MVAESRAFFLNLWYSSDAAAADKGPTGLLLCSCRVPASVYRGRTTVGEGAAQKKGVLGAKKGERAGRTATGGRSVRRGGLQLVPSAGAEARKSR